MQMTGIQHLESGAYRAAHGVVDVLRGAGYEAYFAGGCVRDLLLGVEPKDFDVATSARPEQVQRLFARTEAVGAHFGVVLVIVGGEAQAAGVSAAALSSVERDRLIQGAGGSDAGSRRPDGD